MEICYCSLKLHKYDDIITEEIKTKSRGVSSRKERYAEKGKVTQFCVTISGNIGANWNLIKQHTDYGLPERK